MADFRRKQYSGSLLLVQECGPVDIVVDTDAKTVTPSLAKADSSYSIAGGGGGLDYVIPEQTVTMNNNVATLTGVDVSGLAENDWIIIDIVSEGSPFYTAVSYVGGDVGNRAFSSIVIGPDMNLTISETSANVWQIELSGFEEMTISAIKAPF